VKKIFGSIVFISVFLFITLWHTNSPAQAKDFITLGAGVTFPFLEKSFKDNFNPGYNFGANYGLDISRYLKVRLGFQHSEVTNKIDSVPKFTVTKVGADVMLNDVFIYDIGFYPKLGTGMYILHFDDESQNYLGINIGGGVTYALNRQKNAFLNLETGIDYYFNFDLTAKAVIPLSLSIVFKI
jgi:hypothetical protein